MKKKLRQFIEFPRKFVQTFNNMIFRFIAETWPVEYIIYTATIPSALTGADVAIFASCFAYISDISTVKNRTTRVTILDVCYLSAMPTGVALGNLQIIPTNHMMCYELFPNRILSLQ